MYLYLYLYIHIYIYIWAHLQRRGPSFERLHRAAPPLCLPLCLGRFPPSGPTALGFGVWGLGLGVGGWGFGGWGLGLVG